VWQLNHTAAVSQRRANKWPLLSVASLLLQYIIHCLKLTCWCVSDFVPPSAQAQAERKPAADSAPSDTADTFDIAKDKHRGQYALRRLYHESDRPIAVLYTSPICGPCRTLKPIFNSVVQQYAGKIHYVEIDIEQDPEIAEAAGVNGTPTLQLFKDKERVQNVPGVKQKSQYRQMIEAALETAKVPA